MESRVKGREEGWRKERKEQNKRVKDDMQGLHWNPFISMYILLRQ